MSAPLPTFNPPANVEVAEVEVAVKFRATASPTTESFAYGDVVPRPRLPEVLKMKPSLVTKVPPSAGTHFSVEDVLTHRDGG